MSTLATTYPWQMKIEKPFDISQRVRADPFPFYAWMRAEQPVYRAKWGRL